MKLILFKKFANQQFLLFFKINILIFRFLSKFIKTPRYGENGSYEGKYFFLINKINTAYRI